jgi:hypothetical protein
MKQRITGIALVSMLVFTATAWSQESPMEHGKMGMGKMEMGESSQMKACMQMMGEMETKNAALDGLVGRMQTADGAEKMAVMEEVLTALVAQQREMHKLMRSMPKMMCGGMMRMMMQ